MAQEPCQPPIRPMARRIRGGASHSEDTRAHRRTHRRPGRDPRHRSPRAGPCIPPGPLASGPPMTQERRPDAAARRPDLLDPATLSQLGGIELIAREVVEGFLMGLHRSPHRGFSAEFAELRAYQPGDDLRYIDWRMYGRSDRYYVKQFEEETNLRAHILIDVSESMGWSSRSRDPPHQALVREAPGRLASRWSSSDRATRWGWPPSTTGWWSACTPGAGAASGTSSSGACTPWRRTGGPRRRPPCGTWPCGCDGGGWSCSSPTSWWRPRRRARP